jgi:transposase
MTPRQNSSGGKERLGRTSKRGDKYIRCLLVAGAVTPISSCGKTDRLTDETSGGKP